MSSVSEALTRLIEKYVLPMGPKLMPWQTFREERMYSNEINDLLQMNLYALRKVYELFARNKHFAHQRNLL